MSIVGILSDTHGRLSGAAFSALADCDAIIHAGDIGDPSILVELQAIAPVCAVLGNNDYPEYGPDVQRYANVELCGVRFLVAHYPHHVRIGAHGTRALSPGDPLPRVCVHGHTHVANVESGAAVRPAEYLICPGSVSRPRGGMPASVAKVHIEDAAPNAAPNSGAHADSSAPADAPRITRVWIESILDGSVLMEATGL